LARPSLKTQRTTFARFAKRRRTIKKEGKKMLNLTTVDLTKPEDRELLVGFLQKLAAKISRHDPSLLPDVGPMTGNVYGRAGSEWPIIGANLAAIPKGIFESEAFRERFEPGDVVKTYGAGCCGLRTLASRIDAPIRKIGASLAADIRTRMKDVSRDRYAGLIKIGDEYQIEAGFDAYMATPFVCAARPSPNSPVSIEPRSFSVVLPKQMRFTDFERALQKALQPASLHHWVSTPVGLEHFAKLSIDPAVARRFTNYGYSGLGQPIPAEEIYITRPRSDGDRLVAILETIVLEHLGLVA
jgi:hypothetical protein